MSQITSSRHMVLRSTAPEFDVRYVVSHDTLTTDSELLHMLLTMVDPGTDYSVKFTSRKPQATVKGAHTEHYYMAGTSYGVPHLAAVETDEEANERRAFAAMGY